MAINFKNWQQNIKEALLPEENLDELSKSTIGSYVKKASTDLTNKGASIAKKQSDADEVDRYTNRHMSNQSDERERMKKAVGASQDDINKVRSSAIKRSKNIGKAVDRLTKEDLDEATSPTAGTRLVKKYGSDAHRAEVRYNPEYQEYQVHHYKDGKHMGEGPVSYHGDDKQDAHDTAKSEAAKRSSVKEEISKSDIPAYLRKAKGDKPLTVADVKEPKKSTISAPANLAKARNEETCGKKKTYEQFVAEAAAMVDDGEGVQQEVPAKSVDKRADKKVAKDGRKYSTLIKFNNGEEDGTRVTEDLEEDFDLNEETTYYMEAMIDYSDFQAKVDAHKKAGNKVVDYKHTPEKAHITTIDKEGTKRKVTYKPSGVSMQNMGKHEGEDSDDSGKKVKKTDNEPAVKRGRGRPAGAKSGARQTGSAKQEYRGLAFHSLNLPNKK